MGGTIMKMFNINFKEKIDPVNINAFFDNQATLVNGKIFNFKELVGNKAFLVWVVGCD